MYSNCVVLFTSKTSSTQQWASHFKVMLCSQTLFKAAELYLKPKFTVYKILLDLSETVWVFLSFG